jgi:beta-glucosidase
MYPHQTKDGRRQGRTYRYFTGPVLWPFGFGLSYTRFEYSHSYTSTFLGTYSPCETVDIQAILSMTARDKRGGTTASSDEVVQVYVTIHNSTVTAAKHQLVTFSRVTLTASMQTKALAFRLLPEDHAVLREPDFAQTIEPGLRTVWIGGGQPGTAAPGVTLTFTVVDGASKTVDECAAQPGGTGRAVHEFVAGDTDAHLWSP